MWAAMNYLIAISIMDQEGAYLRHLFGKIVDGSSLQNDKGPSFEQTMFSLAAKMLEATPVLADLYQEENLSGNAGLKILLEDAKQLAPFLQHSTTLCKHFVGENYQEIWDWCRELLVQQKLEKHDAYIRESVLAYDARAANKENTLAVIYFTYQILK
jgi:hypothetical protein